MGAGVTLNATGDESGKPLPRLTWTGLIQNGLEYLVDNGYVDASARRTRQAYEALKDPDPDSLLDAANIMAAQMNQHRQFPNWLESVFGGLYQEIRHPSLLEVLRALHQKGVTLTTNYDDLLEKVCDLRRIIIHILDTVGTIVDEDGLSSKPVVNRLVTQPFTCRQELATSPVAVQPRNNVMRYTPMRCTPVRYTPMRCR